MKTCTYIPISCPYKCKASGNLLKKNLDHHLKEECPRRPHKCKGCGKIGTYEDISGSHDPACPMIEVTCSKCDRLIRRGKMAKHVRTSCSPMKNSPTRATNILREKCYEMKMMMSEPNVLKNGECMDLKLSSYSKLKSEKCKFYFTFCCSMEHYQLVVDCNGVDAGTSQYLSVMVLQLTGRRGSMQQHPSQGTLTMTLLNQLSDSHHYEQSVDLTSHCYNSTLHHCATRINHFISDRELTQRSTMEVQYLVDDALKFKVKVTVPENCPPVSMVDERLEKRALQKSSGVQSEQESCLITIPDYSSEETYVSLSTLNGYNIKVILTTGIHYLSMNIEVKGHSGHFNGTILVELLNQLEDRNHRYIVLLPSSNDVKMGVVTTKNFIHWTKLPLILSPEGNTQYLVKDRLYFRIALCSKRMSGRELKVGKEEEKKPWLECNNNCLAHKLNK